MRRSFAAATLLAAALAMASLGADCSKSRPPECQKLRQCCALAGQANSEALEAVRVQCTRQDDDQAALCQRRLDEVKQAVPSIAMEPACRSGQ
jgi:hypothetical protein